MAKQEIQAGFTDPDEALEEERWRFWDKGYVRIDSAYRNQYENLSQNREETKKLLYSYFFTPRFLHREAHSLCSISRMFPDFCYNSENSEYVLQFQNINSSASIEIHVSFQEWVDVHRKELSQKAAEVLQIPWNEVEAAGPL